VADCCLSSYSCDTAQVPTSAPLSPIMGVVPRLTCSAPLYFTGDDIREGVAQVLRKERGIDQQDRSGAFDEQILVRPETGTLSAILDSCIQCDIYLFLDQVWNPRSKWTQSACVAQVICSGRLWRVAPSSRSLVMQY